MAGVQKTKHIAQTFDGEMGDEKDKIIEVLSHLFVTCCKQETIEPEADVADVMEYVYIDIGAPQLTLERLF
jgi:hypothetical protein